MPDEVITDHASQYSGRARALPLFSCRHMFCSPMTVQSGGFILRDASLGDAPQDEARWMLSMIHLTWKMT
jgi:hypothetical protein